MMYIGSRLTASSGAHHWFEYKGSGVDLSKKAISNKLQAISKDEGVLGADKLRGHPVGHASRSSSGAGEFLNCFLGRGSWGQPGSRYLGTSFANHPLNLRCAQ